MRRFTYGLLAFIGVGLILQVLIPPASAQEVACQFNLTDAKLGLLAAETPHAVLPWNERDHFVAMLESATGFNFPEITNVLLAQLQGGVFYGLEIGGCLTPPAPLFLMPQAKRSGAIFILHV